MTAAPSLSYSPDRLSPCHLRSPPNATHHRSGRAESDATTHDDDDDTHHQACVWSEEGGASALPALQPLREARWSPLLSQGGDTFITQDTIVAPAADSVSPVQSPSQRTAQDIAGSLCAKDRRMCEEVHHAVRATTERLRHLQRAEEATLRRLHRCVANLCSPLSSFYEMSCRDDTRINGGDSLKENVEQPVSNAEEPFPCSSARTVEVLLPVVSHSPKSTPLLMQACHVQLPAAGLTPAASSAYDALRDLLQAVANDTNGVASATANDAFVAARHSLGSVELNHNASPCELHSNEKTSTKAATLSGDVVLDGLLIDGDGNSHSAISPILPSPRQASAAPLNARQLFHASPSPPHSATPPSPVAAEDEADDFFPTPPRRAAMASDSVGGGTLSHRETPPAGAGAPVLLTGGRRESSPTPATLAAAQLHQRSTAFGLSVNDARHPLSAAHEVSGAANTARGVARAAMTATDILATISALPPPPPKLFGACGTGAHTSKSGSSSSSSRLRTTGKSRNANGKRQREGEALKDHIADVSDTQARTGRLKGLPCLGVDVEAAAAAANPQRLPSRVQQNASWERQRRGEYTSVLEGDARAQGTSSLPPSGYVRTRQQRAADVAHAKAVFAAVRRAAGGSDGVNSGRENSATPSYSTASDASQPHTPSQYWDIDFP